MSKLNKTNKCIADTIIEVLRSQNVDTVFSLIATSILDIFDALARQREIQVVIPQHEQAVGFMGDGYARVTGRPAVCIVSAGPGTTNLVTAVAQAYHESTPIVVISSESTSTIHGRGRLLDGGLPLSLPVLATMTFKRFVTVPAVTYPDG